VLGDPEGDEGDAGDDAEDGAEARVAVVDEKQHRKSSFPDNGSG
jgi:hypothetical protein